MKKFCLGTGFLVLAIVLAQPAVAQLTIIDDNLNMDTSANYTVVNGGEALDLDPMSTAVPDGETLWAYDYDAIGIPPAPGTTDGSTVGVRLSVNDTLNNGGNLESEATTIFHNTEIVGYQDYTLTVDVFMGVWAPAETGSTEHAHIGVAGDGMTRNQLFEFNDSDGDGSADCCNWPGSGHFIGISGDGSDSSDYRHWKNGFPVNRYDPDYLSPGGDPMADPPQPPGNTNVTSYNFLGFFDQISNLNADDFEARAGYPGIPGMIGNNWATVKIEVLQSEGKIKYFVRGGTDFTTGDENEPPEFLHLIETNIDTAGDYDGDGMVGAGDLSLVLANWGQDASMTGVPEGWVNMQPGGLIGAAELSGVLSNWGDVASVDGFVSFGLGDLNSSVATIPEDNFAIFDNFKITGVMASAVPEPASLMLVLLGCLALAARRH